MIFFAVILLVDCNLFCHSYHTNDQILHVTYAQENHIFGRHPPPTRHIAKSL